MLVVFGNSFNLHQVNLSDALFELSAGDYLFVETDKPLFDSSLEGKRRIERPYVLAAYQDEYSHNEAMRLAREADVVFFGANSFEFEIERMSLDKPGLSFEGSERWLKRGLLNILSPELLKNMWYYHTGGWKKKPLYKLCSSAYGAGDQYRLQSFKGRCYKWGYFTEVRETPPETHSGSIASNKVSLMWCARFIRLKHPELVIEIARRLKDSRYDVQIDMYGNGKELEAMQSLSSLFGVQDIVSFKGSVPNTDILRAMREHDIFLFTSDKNEGWGAVLNESMSNGCVAVASDAIGSVPFLIKDGENGIVFKSGCIESLYEKVLWLIENPERRMEMATRAYYTMRDVWSPHQAAKNFLQLIDDLRNGRDTSVKEGPCSKALPIY